MCVVVVVFVGGGGVVQRPRQSSVGTPRDGRREGSGKGEVVCSNMSGLGTTVCLLQGNVPTQNNERALPLLNKKSHFCFLLPLKVMELEIGSPHKSLQSVGSLVWPSAVPKLRSLSTGQSRAKHIFIDCACVCLEGRRACVYAHI